MDLSNIKAGKKVELKIKRDTTVATFETAVIEVVDNCLVCEPVLHEGRLVNFAIPDITREADIFDETVGKLYGWKDVEIKAGYFKKTTLCHLLYLNSAPFEINRRNDYRQYIGINGLAEPFHRPKVDVIVRDVSNNGIGFIAEDKGNFEVGRHVSVSFSDEGGKYRFYLECKIVRERQMENGCYEVGCAVIAPPPTFSQYVVHKQLQERRKVLGLDLASAGGLAPQEKK